MFKPLSAKTKSAALRGWAAVATVLAVLFALVPGALLSTAQAFTPPPNDVQFTLEGCRNNGGIVLPMNFGGTDYFACMDSAYTSGNLGKGWNELDNVPFRMITKNGGSSSSTFNVIVAADHKPGAGGITGYQNISAVYPPFRNSATGCSAISGPEQIATGVTGGTNQTIYRQLTLTVPAGETCQFEWYNTLALGASKYPGSSLQAYMFQSDNFQTGKKTIPLPVNQILPQSLSKTMTATRGSGNTWNVVKTPTPARLTLNTCDVSQDPSSSPVSIKVEWTKSPPQPDGNVAITTNITAKNPASRTVTVNLTDRIYAGTNQTQLLDEKVFAPLQVAANSTQTVTHTYNWAAPTGATSVNDVATATYTDPVTGQTFPGNTTATASANIQTTASNNGSAQVVDVENLTGPAGTKFSAGATSIGSYVNYTPGTKTTGPVNWNSGAVSASGDVTFLKNIYIPKGTIGNGKLQDTATLTDTGGGIATSDASIDIIVDTQATLTISKTIPNILTGNETATFTFDVKDSNGQVVADDVPISFAAGDTSKTAQVSGLAPDSYTVVENPVPAGWDSDGNQSVDLTGAKCAGTAQFNNTVTQATARAVKTTVPVGLQKDWEMTLTRTDTDPDQVTKVRTDAGGTARFGQLAEGSYTITEENRPGWDAGTPQGTCSFTINYPADSGRMYECTFNNTQRGKIVVEKFTDPADSTQEFTFTPGGWNENEDFPLKDGESFTSEPLIPGSGYSVAETVPDGWDQSSATCNDGSPINAIDVAPGETVTCTFNNTQRGKIVVEKFTDPADSTQEFTFTPGGWNENEDFPLKDGESFTSEPLIPGSGYSVAETVPDGWDQSSATCNDGSPINAIDVAPGETVTCTFNNTQRGNIIVKKMTDPASDTTTEFTFNPSWSDDNFKLKNKGSEDSGLLEPGAYDVSEINLPTGWDLSKAECDGTGNTPDEITLGAGQTVTCTFNNTQRGNIIVKKLTDPASDTTTEFTFKPELERRQLQAQEHGLRGQRAARTRHLRRVRGQPALRVGTHRF